jgi:hypothetical protein
MDTTPASAAPLLPDLTITLPEPALLLSPEPSNTSPVDTDDDDPDSMTTEPLWSCSLDAITVRSDSIEPPATSVTPLLLVPWPAVIDTEPASTPSPPRRIRDPLRVAPAPVDSDRSPLLPNPAAPVPITIEPLDAPSPDDIMRFPLRAASLDAVNREIDPVRASSVSFVCTTTLPPLCASSLTSPP